MLWKRTTAPDGIPGSPGPPATAGHSPTEPAKRHIGSGRQVALELARSVRRLHHRPTVAQLRTMAALGGRAPASYRLDAAVNRLPDALPADFPYGTDGLRFAHSGGERVALPNGWGFEL